MKRSATDPSGPAASPFQALRAQANARPQAEALRAKQHGVWRPRTWSLLAAQAAQTAHRWATLGVQAGDSIVAVGPLSPHLIVTLFAADALHATLVVGDSASEPQLLADARFVYAEGTHELARVARHRGPALQALMLGDDALVVEATEGVAWHTVASGLEVGLSPARALPEGPRAGPLVQVHTANGVVHTWSGGRDGARSLYEPGARVLADFEPHWSRGLRFVAETWPVFGPLLLIPEPGGHADTDRRQAAASLWLASPERLAEAATGFHQRRPSRGLADRGLRAALAEPPGPIGRWLRTRLRSVWGAGTLRQVLSDGRLDETTRQTLAALQIAPVPATLAALAPVPPHAHVSPRPAVAATPLAELPLALAGLAP